MAVATLVPSLPVGLVPIQSVANTMETGEAHPQSLYFLLTGQDWALANTESDAAFDRHVLACILAMAWSEMMGGDIAAHLGLTPTELEHLLKLYFPLAIRLMSRHRPSARRGSNDEAEMIAQLLAEHAAPTSVAPWLTKLVARRALEANHLWEDLGLRDRRELTRLLMRHFGTLAARNTRNMRWKRFFYRSLCENDGLVMCTAPVCTACADFDLCFGEETGESQMARARRDQKASA